MDMLQSLFVFYKTSWQNTYFNQIIARWRNVRYKYFKYLGPSLIANFQAKDEVNSVNNRNIFFRLMKWSRREITIKTEVGIDITIRSREEDIKEVPAFYHSYLRYNLWIRQVDKNLHDCIHLHSNITCISVVIEVSLQYHCRIPSSLVRTFCLLSTTEVNIYFVTS